MPLQYVLVNVLGDLRFESFQRLEVTGSHFRRHLVPDMDQLPEIGIVFPACRIMPQGIHKLLGRPAVHHINGRQSILPDIDDAGIGPAQLIETRAGGRIDIPGNGQPLPIGSRQPDHFLQPGGAGRLKVQPRLASPHRLADYRVQGKLVTARVDTELQVTGQFEFTQRKRNHIQILAELTLELPQIPDVIHTLVESPGEFGRNGLRRNTFVRDGRQDKEQFNRSLSGTRFIHRHFGHKGVAAAGRLDPPIDASRFLHRQEELARNPADHVLRNRQGGTDARHTDFPDITLMPAHKGLHGITGRRLADEIRHIQREEITSLHEQIDIAKADMIRINKIRSTPPQGLDRRVRFGTDILGDGMHNRVLPVRLIPDRHHLDPQLPGIQECLKLGFPLVRKTVTDPHRILIQQHTQSPCTIRLLNKNRAKNNPAALERKNHQFPPYIVLPGQGTHAIGYPITLARENVVYLKTLEMVGFKSFANRTHLEFEPGMTAIVGPNGCGKSNISDAMRWVLGEQSAKALRGAKMEDVIFNGTDARKPLNMAEVSVTFADCDAALGMEYREVTITRRVFRTGEGQYFINKTPCRLKDIQRLFMDTGVGTTSYSLMEQGRIDQILSSRPEDRREVFEEASGITKFKADKREALRKLDHTEANLLRLADVIREVKRQIGSLQRQAGKARRYQQMHDELRKVDILATRERLSLFDRDIKELQDNLEIAQNGLKTTQLTVDELENTSRGLRQGLVETEHTIGTAREQAVQLQGKLDHTRELIEVSERQIVEYRTLSERDSREIETTSQQLHITREALATMESRVEKLRVENRQAQLTLDEVTRRYTEHSTRIESARRDLQAYRTESIEQESLATRLQNQYLEIEGRERSQVIQRERLAAERAHLDDVVNNFQKRQSEMAAILKTLRDEMTFWQQQVQTLEQQRQSTEQQIAERSQTLASLQSRHAARQAQCELLKENLDTGEGLPGGTRALLDPASLTDIDPSRLLGTLVSHLDVDADHQVALETCLRAWVDALVVCDLPSALDLVHTLQQRNSGSIRLVTADAPPAGGSHRSGDGDYLLDHVRASERVKPWINHLLASVRIVPDTSAIPRPIPPGESFVTRDGILAHHDGRIELYQRDEAAPNLFARRQALAEADAERIHLAQEVETVGHGIHQLKTTLEPLGGRIRDARTNLEKSARALAQKEGENQLVEKEAHDTTHKLETVSFELESISQQGSAGDQEKQSVEQKLRETRQRREQLAETITQSNRELQRLEQTFQQCQNDLTDARVRNSEIAQSLKHEESRLESATARLQELQDHLNGRSAGIEDYRHRITVLEQSIEQARSGLGALETAVREHLERIDTLQEARSRQTIELEDSQTRINRQRAALESFHEQKSALDVAFTEKRMRRQNEVDRVTSEYRISLDQMAEETEPEWENGRPAADAMDTYVAELRTKLDAMGPVNLVAIEEHKELEERYAFLTSQEQDLVNAKQQLMDMIRTINKTTTEMFRSTFEQANANFQAMFQRLFNGGSARLVLVNEEDVLECGIEIIARPPGKRLQNVSLLSGGERTMTAVALLFSIYMIKPSPFCMLDELDAALDEANIGRFVSVLGDFLKQSQFVVVTHNRKTIAAAAVLYGVTMHEKGISEIVSMKFNPSQMEAGTPAKEPSHG